MSQRDTGETAKMWSKAGTFSDDPNRTENVQPFIPGLGRGAIRPRADGVAGFIPPAGMHNKITRAVSGGRSNPSGARAANGGDVGPLGGHPDFAGPRFTQLIKPGGYAWWYVDAISDDGYQALTLIGFIGSVFSPYYAWANAKAPANPENHCAMNVVLYQRRGGRWAMTERGADRLSRTAKHLQIGNSVMQWENGTLTAEIDEISVPVPRRIRGRLTLSPLAVHTKQFNLDTAGRHRWQPIAPMARIKIEFQNPNLSWQGNAYFDSNDGDAPLATDFMSWQWSRANGKSAATIFYSAKRRDGTCLLLGLEAQADGRLEHVRPPAEQPLPNTVWRVARSTHSDTRYKPMVLKTLEDAPFYNRSIIRAQANGKIFDAVHESLDLNRFGKPWVKLLLPFRMPRI